MRFGKCPPCEGRKVKGNQPYELLAMCDVHLRQRVTRVMRAGEGPAVKVGPLPPGVTLKEG